MRIPCVCCGERGVDEFSYLGDATRHRPTDGGAVPTAAWSDYIYLRDNPAGPHKELWYHGSGCRSWLVVTRDTRSHAILGVALARDVALTGDAS
jgi:heterotetrameric sarcosine oxidase delta subunit